jgi:hypothetical protein
MKPKEFIEKYNLANGWNPRKQSQFLTDMTSELIALLELNHAQNNIKGFDNAVHVIRMKWDVISNKIPYSHPYICGRVSDATAESSLIYGNADVYFMQKGNLGITLEGCNGFPTGEVLGYEVQKAHAEMLCNYLMCIISEYSRLT